MRSIRLAVIQEKKSMHNILQLIHATIVLHNMLIDFNDTTDNLPPPEVDDYIPHPNDIFDTGIGQEIIWDSSTRTHANFLGHLGDLGVIPIN
jgi:hypothetical protein